MFVFLPIFLPLTYKHGHYKDISLQRISLWCCNSTEKRRRKCKFHFILSMKQFFSTLLFKNLISKRIQLQHLCNKYIFIFLLHNFSNIFIQIYHITLVCILKNVTIFDGLTFWSYIKKHLCTTALNWRKYFFVHHKLLCQGIFSGSKYFFFYSCSFQGEKGQLPK